MLQFFERWVLLPVCAMLGVAGLLLSGASDAVALFGGIALGGVAAVTVASVLKRTADLRDGH